MVRDWGAMEERDGNLVRMNEGEDGRSAVAVAAVFVGPPAVGGRLSRPLLDDGERLGVRVLQGRGETTGHRPRVRWVMAVGGVVVGGMTAC